MLIILQGSRDQSVAAVLKRDPGGQFVVAPQTRRQMLQAALVEAREEADRLFNITEPALSNQGWFSSSFWGYWCATCIHQTKCNDGQIRFRKVKVMSTPSFLRRIGVTNRQTFDFHISLSKIFKSTSTVSYRRITYISFIFYLILYISILLLL